mmetsp:Transcript_28642/g.77554  ORF Transcript_28642/g.77554 Transcript_28642/m.77554 type:complete len:98 (-) Transcript_28642:124-417(-)
MELFLSTMPFSWCNSMNHVLNLRKKETVQHNLSQKEYCESIPSFASENLCNRVWCRDLSEFVVSSTIRVTLLPQVADSRYTSRIEYMRDELGNHTYL